MGPLTFVSGDVTDATSPTTGALASMGPLTFVSGDARTCTRDGAPI